MSEPQTCEVMVGPRLDENTPRPFSVRCGRPMPCHAHPPARVLDKMADAADSTVITCRNAQIRVTNLTRDSERILEITVGGAMFQCTVPAASDLYHLLDDLLDLVPENEAPCTSPS